ncbi:MAG: hypothetical protein AAGF77_08415 [Bacteroidota bacterium]
MRFYFIGWLFPLWIVAQGSFSDAVGFGQKATGGRGGVVVNITNLKDAGRGSLRAAIERHNNGLGATTITFNGLSGTIVLNDQLYLSRGDLTIAGQTAAGNGILIRRRASQNDHAGIFIDGADNVIISGLRIRLGQHHNPKGYSQGDCISIYDGSRIYLRNLSLSWSTDETLGIFGDCGRRVPQDITIHDVIIGEPLAYTDDSKSYRAKADSRALIIGGCTTRVSIYNTYIVSSADRQPFIGGDPNKLGQHEIDGLLLNGASAFLVKFGDDDGEKQINFRNFVSLNRKGFADRRPIVSVNGLNRIARDNRSIFTDQQFSGDDVFGEFELGLRALSSKNLTTAFFPFPMRDFPNRSKSRIIADIKQHAGAFPRDAVDTRFLGYLNGTPRMTLLREDNANLQYPQLKGSYQYRDMDKDGISRAFERLLGTSDRVPSHNNDHDNDGRTDLEEYLESILIPRGTARASGLRPRRSRSRVY